MKRAMAENQENQYQYPLSSKKKQNSLNNREPLSRIQSAATNQHESAMFKTLNQPAGQYTVPFYESSDSSSDGELAPLSYQKDHQDDFSRNLSQELFSPETSRSVSRSSRHSFSSSSSSEAPFPGMALGRIEDFDDDDDDDNSDEFIATPNKQRFQNQIAASLLDELINRSVVIPETNPLFAELVYIAEMFNRFVMPIYNTRNLALIDCPRLIKSVSGEDSGEYFDSVFRMLFEILLGRLQTTQVGFFKLHLGEFDSGELDIEEIMLLLLSSMAPIGRNSIFHGEEETIKSMESVLEIPLVNRIKICARLVDYLGFEGKDSNGANFQTRKRELNRECQEINQQLRVLATKNYQLSAQNDYDQIKQLREERESLFLYLTKVQQTIKDMDVIEPFGHLEYVDEQDDSKSGVVSLWEFECLKGCLVLEKRRPIDFSECVSIDSCFESDWCLISDPDDIKRLYEGLKNQWDYNVSYRISNLFRKSRDTSVALNQDIASFKHFKTPVIEKNEQKIKSSFQNILKKMSDLKEKIFANEMIKYELTFNPADRSIESFEMDRVVLENFEFALKSADKVDLEILKLMLGLLYEMTFKKYLKKIDWPAWLSRVNESRTLNETSLLLYVFSEGVNWSLLEFLPNCVICADTGVRKTGAMEKCVKCAGAYHLTCLLGQDKSDIKFALYNKAHQKRYTSILCKSCFQEWEKEQMAPQMVLPPEIEAVDLGRYPLRPNKQRIERALEDEEEKTRRTSRKKLGRSCKKDPIIDVQNEEGDDMEPRTSETTDSDVVTRKRRRKNVIESSSEATNGDGSESSQATIKPKRGRPKKESDASAPRNSKRLEAQSTKHEQKAENKTETDLKRVQLGLRPRKAFKYSGPKLF